MRRWCGIAWLALGFLTGLAGAQQTSAPVGGDIQPQPWPPPPDQAPALAVRPAPAPPAEPGRFELDVVVTDKAGKPVSGLEESDFTVLDNNRPAKIVAFHAYGGAAQPEQPVQVILVVDAANEGFDNVSNARYAIDQFLRRDGGRLAQPVGILWLMDNGLKVQSQPSMDGNELAAQLDANAGSLREIGRSTGFFGAEERYQLSLQALDRIVESETKVPGRKLLIWVGPGWPLLSGPNITISWKEQQQLFHNVVSLNTRLEEADMSLYSVTHGIPDTYTYMYEGYLKGVKKAQQVNPGDLDLKVLAVQSGGRAMIPSNDLASEIADCAADAEAFYTLRFDPPPADGPDEYHELKVHVDKPHLTARTRTGYYDEPAGVAAP